MNEKFVEALELCVQYAESKDVFSRAILSAACDGIDALAELAPDREQEPVCPDVMGDAGDPPMPTRDDLVGALQSLLSEARTELLDDYASLSNAIENRMEDDEEYVQASKAFDRIGDLLNRIDMGLKCTHPSQLPTPHHDARGHCRDDCRPTGGAEVTYRAFQSIICRLCGNPCRVPPGAPHVCALCKSA